MDNPQLPPKVQWDLTHCYLEVARAAMTQIHTKAVPGLSPEMAEISPPLLSAKFSLVSITVLYSFLAIESFLNYQLYQLWKRRSESSVASRRFLEELGDEAEFERLKVHPKMREIPARLKTYCKIVGFALPHERIPDTWRRLSELVEESRHFLVHAYPDPVHFHGNMARIMGKTKSGEYVRVTEEILAFLWAQSGKAAPEWLAHNTLLAFRGVTLLPVLE